AMAQLPSCFPGATAEALGAHPCRASPGPADPHLAAVLVDNACDIVLPRGRSVPLQLDRHRDGRAANRLERGRPSSDPAIAYGHLRGLLPVPARRSLDGRRTCSALDLAHHGALHAARGTVLLGLV